MFQITYPKTLWNDPKTVQAPALISHFSWIRHLNFLPMEYSKFSQINVKCVGFILGGLKAGLPVICVGLTTDHRRCIGIVRQPYRVHSRVQNTAIQPVLSCARPVQPCLIIKTSIGCTCSAVSPVCLESHDGLLQIPFGRIMLLMQRGSSKPNIWSMQKLG